MIWIKDVDAGEVSHEIESLSLPAADDHVFDCFAPSLSAALTQSFPPLPRLLLLLSFHCLLRIGKD